MTDIKIGQALGYVRRAVSRSAASLLKKPAVYSAAAAAARAALGFMLARAEIFGGAAPFGVGYAASAGLNLQGLIAICGAAGGYWSLESVTGTLLTACVFILFALKLFLRGTALARTSWAMPAVSGTAYLCALLPYIISRHWPPGEAVYFCTGIILSAGSAYFYSEALKPPAGHTEEEERNRREVSILILLMTALMSLSGVTLMANISLGRLLATLAVMVAARSGGTGWGSTCGICAGLAMDTALNDTPFFSMAYAFSGMLSGVFRWRSRLTFTVTYVLASAVAALWAFGSTMRITIFYETFVASVLFFIVPEGKLPSVSRLFPEKEENSGAQMLRDYSRYRLEKTARAFRELYEAMSRAFASPKKNNSADPASIFTSAAERACKKCRKASICWGTNSMATHAAMNDAMQRILSRGSAAEQDFPTWFKKDCTAFPEYLSAVNEELRLMLERRSINARQRENDKLLCRQYSELSHILTDCAEEFSTELTFDTQAEKKLKKLISSKGLNARGSVFRGEHGRLHAEIEGEDLPSASDADGFKSEIEKQLGIRLCLPEEIKGSFGRRFCFLEAEPLKAIAGAAAGKRAGEKVSGDSATYFKTPEGLLYVLLSDGMGSGEGAAEESRMTLCVLERFLKAGVSAEIALRTVDSALLLKNREEGAFATLDLLRLNLFTGEADLFKFGAAPTYVKRGRSVTKIGRNSFPIGSGCLRKIPERTRLVLDAGDYVVMTSDGLSDRDDDAWLVDMLREYHGSSPRELAASLLAEGARRSGAADDITAYVFKLDNTS
ncbi:MAG: SpoIIE family protein phosphatase [Clostridiales bacterium]|nr:SpoIIE family protein phosphatase [Clostridiales bacterium]